MKREIKIALAWGGGMLLLALAAKFAHEQGYIDSDTTQRAVAMNGLMIAYYGNLIPKKVAPRACLKQVQRVGGWIFVLCGLVYAGFWAFAPIPLALTVGTGAVAAGLVATLGYCFWRMSIAKIVKM